MTPPDTIFSPLPDEEPLPKMTKIECPFCGQHYSLELGPQAVSVSCQKCGAKFVAEAMGDAAERPISATPISPRVPPVPSHSPTNTTMRYYYISANNQAAGPVDQGQLQELFRLGQITGETGIALEGTSNWIPFRQVQFQQQAVAAHAIPNPPGYYAGSTTQEQAQSPKKVILAAWLMIGVTCLVALIPGIGFLTWLIAAPILLVTFIIGIVALNKGETTQGIMILLASLIVAPLFLFFAPILTTAIAVGGSAAAASSTAKEELVREIQNHDNASGLTESESSLGEPAPSPVSPKIVRQNAVAQVGETVTLNGLQLEISGLNRRSIIGDGFGESKVSKGGVYLVVDWTYKNASKKPMGAFSKPDLSLVSPDGTEYEEDMGATVSRATEVDLDEKILSNLNPGITVQSTSVFEVAENLLAESGWRIQIEFDDQKTFFSVNGGMPTGGSSIAIPESPTSTNSGDGEDALAAVKKAQIESELALKQAAVALNSKEKMAELKGELATVSAKIESERARYQAGLDTINRLTNFKKTPVQEGTQAYFQCLEASKVIKEVESGAADLKAEKARLEAMIKELEK